MNWIYELETQGLTSAATQRHTLINTWARSETAYNCSGCYYRKDYDSFGFASNTKLKPAVSFRLHFANALRALADKIYPLALPYTKASTSTSFCK